MISYKNVLEKQSLSDVKMGRGSPICERVRKKIAEYFKNNKVQGSRLFVTYTIIQGIISSEMEVRTGPLNGQCKKIKIKDDT